MTQLTKNQIEALEVAFAKGGAWYGLRGSRAGGAYSRMCDRLAATGMVERAGPHAITVLGLKALEDFFSKRWARHGRQSDIIRLDEVRAAIAKATGAA